MPQKSEHIPIGQRSYLITADDDYFDVMKNGFEPGMTQLFTALIKREHTVFDVGANIGFTAILFGELAHTVHAFEPSPSTFSFLRTNIEASGLSNITIHNLGLGQNNEAMVLTINSKFRAGAFISEGTNVTAGYEKEEIQIRRMDSLVQDLRIQRLDFVKIDVEGFELHVLRGGMEVIRRFQPVVVAELNHWCLNAFQRTSVPDYFDYLRSVFPIVLAVDDNNHIAANLFDEDQAFSVMYEHIIHFKYSNVLCAFKDEQLNVFRDTYKIVG